MFGRLKLVGSTSHDPDTQTACILTAQNGQVLLTASNQLPFDVPRKPERLVRPAKYQYIMHAERNLVVLAARKGIETLGCTLLLNWFPCLDCALTIVQAGIRELVADREKYEARKDDPRYNFAESMQILTEGGVEINWLQDPACPSCHKHGVTFEPRSCQSVETHGLDCGPYERFFNEWYDCSACGAAISKDEVADAIKEAECKSTS